MQDKQLHTYLFLIIFHREMSVLDKRLVKHSTCREINILSLLRGTVNSKGMSF